MTNNILRPNKLQLKGKDSRPTITFTPKRGNRPSVILTPKERIPVPIKKLGSRYA